MEDQDKLYEQFRGAAEKAESQGFSRMDAVWGRVEEKLENKKHQRTATWWKYTGMAAILLLFITVGTFLFTNESPSETPKGTQENSITVIDTQKIKNSADAVKEDIVSKENTVAEKNDAGEVTMAQEEVVANNVLATPVEIIEGDSIHFTPVTKRSRVWNSTTNIGTTIGYSNSASSAMLETYSRDKYYEKAASFTNNNGTIAFSGTVIDSQGMPIPGATVSDSKGKSVQTDFDGKYTITINEGDKLTASYIGMQNSSVLGWSGNNNTTLQMSDDTVALSEVVVQSNRAKTPVSNMAVKSIPSKPIDEMESKEYEPSLNGTMASIDEGKVKQRVYKERNDQGTFKATGELTGNKDSDADAKTASKAEESMITLFQEQQQGPDLTTGQPGPTSTIMLRGAGSVNGTTEALYIVDGVPMNANEFSKIDANDIAEINVLKDAAATSIYGNRGANGVIVVKTKNALTPRQLKKQAKKLKKQLKESEKQIKDANNAKDKN